MSFLDRIVNVSISRAPIGITSASLNRILILGNTNKDKGVRTKLYSSLAEVAVDFITASPEYKAAALALGQDIKPVDIMIGQALDAEELDAAYTSISLNSPDFYGVVACTKDAVKIQAIAELVEADSKPRIIGISSNDVKTLTSGDTTHIIYKLKNKGYLRTFGVYSTMSDNYPEAAIFGKMFTRDPGSATWAMKQVSGVNADVLSDTNLNILSNLNCNSYIKFSNLNALFYEGVMAGGEWIDAIQAIDYIKTNIQTEVFNVLLRLDKVGFDTDGLSAIESAIRIPLVRAARLGLIDEKSISITIPDLNNISASDRAARKLKNVVWEARLINAIHAIEIKGTLEN